MYKNSIVAKVSTRKEQGDRTRNPLDTNKGDKEGVSPNGRWWTPQKMRAITFLWALRFKKKKKKSHQGPSELKIYFYCCCCAGVFPHTDFPWVMSAKENKVWKLWQVPRSSAHKHPKWTIVSLLKCNTFSKCIDLLPSPLVCQPRHLQSTFLMFLH